MSNIVGQAADVQHTFSSWDACMAKAYCKWPAIVGITIGSLIALTVLYCVSKIICCGAKCCFCFADMAKCCCCGGGGKGGTTNHYHNTAPPAQNGWANGGPYGANKSGYVNPAAYNSSGGVGYAGQGQYRSQPPPKYGVAQFETPSKSAATVGDGPGADALPAMPSWSDARSRQVEDTSAVELEKLNPAGVSQGSLPKFETDDYKYGRGDSAHGDGALAGAAAVGAAGLATTGARRYPDAHRQDSYGSGVGQGYGQQGQQRPQRSPYDSQDLAYGQAYGHQDQGYGQGRNGYGRRDEEWGQADHSYGQQQGYGRQDQGYGQSQNSAYGHQDRSYGRGGDQGYGRQQDHGYGGQQSPGYAARDSPYAQHDGYQDARHGGGEPRSPSYSSQYQGQGYGQQQRPPTYASRAATASPPQQQSQPFQSYRTYSPSPPLQQQYTARQAYPAAAETSLPAALAPGGGGAGGDVARKPVQGSWRDL